MSTNSLRLLLMHTMLEEQSRLVSDHSEHAYELREVLARKPLPKHIEELDQRRDVDLSTTGKHVATTTACKRQPA